LQRCKLSKFGIHHPQIEHMMLNIGSSLCNISYETINKGFISIVVERWHYAPTLSTSFVGEMTIMLDDMSSLLHLPIRRQFCSYVALYFTLVSVKFHGLKFGDGLIELRQCRGAHVKLSWWCEVYEECIVH